MRWCFCPDYLRKEEKVKKPGAYGPLLLFLNWTTFTHTCLISFVLRVRGCREEEPIVLFYYLQEDFPLGYATHFLSFLFWLVIFSKWSWGKKKPPCPGEETKVQQINTHAIIWWLAKNNQLTKKENPRKKGVGWGGGCTNISWCFSFCLFYLFILLKRLVEEQFVLEFILMSSPFRRRKKKTRNGVCVRWLMWPHSTCWRASRVPAERKIPMDNILNIFECESLSLFRLDHSIYICRRAILWKLCSCLCAFNEMAGSCRIISLLISV